MEGLRYLDTNSDVSPGHMAKNRLLIALIQVVGMGFYIAWER